MWRRGQDACPDSGKGVGGCLRGKFPKAVAKITDNLGELPGFCDYLAERDQNRGGARIRDDTPPHHPGAITTRAGPEFTTKNEPAGATSGDHTHLAGPYTFSELIKRWLPIARGQPEAADALIKLAWCASPAWQATTGLQWVEELIGGNFAAVADRCYYLTRWLGDVRTILPGEADAARWRRVVDGLAAAGDNRAAWLQQAEE